MEDSFRILGWKTASECQKTYFSMWHRDRTGAGFRTRNTAFVRQHLFFEHILSHNVTGSKGWKISLVPSDLSSEVKCSRVCFVLYHRPTHKKPTDQSDRATQRTRWTNVKKDADKKGEKKGWMWKSKKEWTEENAESWQCHEWHIPIGPLYRGGSKSRL